MKFMIPAVMAATAAPAVHGWSLLPSHRLLSTDVLLDTPLTATTLGGVLKRQRDLANRMWEQTDRLIQESSPFPTSPRYEWVDDDEKFQLSLDVPGVKPEDMTIDLERDGYITIRGERVAKTEDSSFASKFSQTFSLDPSVDLDSFTANLDSGVLVISAAKDKSKVEEKVRKIPITAGADVNKALHASATDAVTDEAPKKGEKVEITTEEKK
jgi:HSP20 family protein